MPTLDVSTLLNWIISGLIGLLFGSIGAWYTHRLQLKRENLAWQREKEKLQKRFEQEKILLELQFQHKLLELEKQVERQQNDQVRAEILKGLDNPEENISRFKKFEKMMSVAKPNELILRMVSPLLDKDIISKLEVLLAKEHDEKINEFRVSFDEMLKALDTGKLMPQEFQERLAELLLKTVSQSEQSS